MNIGDILKGPTSAVNTAVIGPLESAWKDFTGQSGIEAANQANLQLGREQMVFQERMSNTAHQREVEDLRKAGINPILGSGSGASTPTGSLPTQESTKSGVQAAMLGILSMLSNMAKTSADIKNTNIDSVKKLVEAENSRKMSGILDIDYETKGYQAKYLRSEIGKKKVLQKFWDGLDKALSDEKPAPKGLDTLIKKAYEKVKSVPDTGTKSWLRSKFNPEWDK